MSTYTVIAEAPETPEAEEIWLAQRPNFVGASESAAILGLSPWSTPMDVWESKQDGAQPIAENRFMTWGKRLEPVVAQWAQADFGERLGTLLPSPGLLSFDALPWLSATPDRENTYTEDGFVTAVTELKTGSAFGRAAWFEDGEETVPPYYEVQVQQQMIVRGLRRGFIAALIGGNELIMREVEYSPSFAELLLTELDEWRTRYVLGGERPPATARDVHRFHGAPKGEPDAQIVASEAVRLLVDERNTIQPQASALAKRDEVVKNEIRAFMGDRTELVDENGKLLVSWYAAKATDEFDVDAFRSDEPNLFAEFSHPGPRIMDRERLEATWPEIAAEYTRPVLGRRTMRFAKP